MRANNLLRKSVSLGLPSFVFVAAMSLSGCARDTKLVIKMGTPLRFAVSGPRTLNHFEVTGPDLEREPHPEGDGDRLMVSKVYWEVVASPGAGRSLDEIGPIVYGKVHNGFVQVQPVGGAAPPPLLDRNLYNVTLTVNNDLGINRFFAIRDGRIVAEGQR
jgi:hypothetical protein